MTTFRYKCSKCGTSVLKLWNNLQLMIIDSGKCLINMFIQIISFIEFFTHLPDILLKNYQRKVVNQVAKLLEPYREPRVLHKINLIQKSKLLAIKRWVPIIICHNTNMYLTLVFCWDLCKYFCCIKKLIHFLGCTNHGNAAPKG